MKYTVYILRCGGDGLYTGLTCSLKKRIKKHIKGEAALYTKGKKQIRLVYKEEFDDRIPAEKREKQIKGWRREKKENLIKFGHPAGKKVF